MLVDARSRENPKVSSRCKQKREMQREFHESERLNQERNKNKVKIVEWNVTDVNAQSKNSMSEFEANKSLKCLES